MHDAISAVSPPGIVQDIQHLQSEVWSFGDLHHLGATLWITPLIYLLHAMVNNVHKPPDSYLTQIMYGNVFAFFYHTLPYHGMFKDTLLGYLWQHKQCKNRHPGLQASIKLLSFSHSSRYCAGVYLPLSHFCEALSCDKRHWVASFTVSCWVGQAAIQRPLRRRNACGERVPRKLLNFRHLLDWDDWDFSLWWSWYVLMLSIFCFQHDKSQQCHPLVMQWCLDCLSAW